MNKRDSLPWYPWFPEAFEVSTAGWSFMDRAIYRALLDLQWQTGKNPENFPGLSQRIYTLAHAINLDPATLKKHWAVVGQKFVEVEGRLQNIRLEKHRLRAIELRRKKSEGGRKGGLARQGLLHGVRKALPTGTPSNTFLDIKNKTLPPYPPSRKRAANGGRSAAARPTAAGSGTIREDDPEVQRKRREAETLAARLVKPRDDGMPF